LSLLRFLEVHLSSVKPTGWEEQLSQVHSGGFLFLFQACEEDVSFEKACPKDTE
jgi:hypothetical protein